MNRVTQILESVDLMSIMPPDANLRSVGRDRWRGKCPIGRHSAGGFSVMRHKNGHLVFQCFSCHSRGSVIDLYAAIEGVTNAAAIRALSEGTTELSEDAIMQRIGDQLKREIPGFGYVTCSRAGCRNILAVETGLDYAILQDNGAGAWTVCHDGSADCGRNHVNA